MPKKQSYIKKTDVKGQKPWLKKVNASEYKVETVAPNKTILIVCEGQTEELYFKSFLVSTLTVKLFSLGQSKLQLVENTERIQQIEQCDEVWCVYDLDIKLDVANCIPDFDNSIAKAKELGYNVAYSNDAFELWFCQNAKKQHRRMKILLMSIGTRGDIEPFLAIGEILAKNGHQIVYAIPEQYRDLIPENGKKHSFTSRFLNLIEGEDGKIVMGGTMGLNKIRAIVRLMKEGMVVNKILVMEQFNIVKSEEPELIIHNGKCNYPLLWNLATGKKIVLISPIPYFIHYVKGFGHTGFSFYYGEFINKLTYKIANFGLIKTIYDAQKILPFSESKVCKNVIKDKLFSEKLIYTISPSLFTKPTNWRSNVQVLGYHERDKKIDWYPDEQIIQFIEKHQKILFLTFGSMINSNPEKTTQTILNVLSQLKVPTIINLAAGGLVQLEEFKENDLFYFTKQIPYDWVLEKCYGIIHHGGSGTTHSSIKYGCVSMILPHIFDQFGWNNLTAKKGLGPKGVAINKITEKNLKPLIVDLLENKRYKLKASEIAEKMGRENFKNELYASIMN